MLLLHYLFLPNFFIFSSYFSYLKNIICLFKRKKLLKNLVPFPEMILIAGYRLLLTIALTVRAEKILVSKDESVIPCSGCLKSNSFLDALDRAFQSDENYHIMLEDESFHIDSEALKLFLDGKTIRSPHFTESLTEGGREIFIKGNNMSSEIVFYEQPISININRIRLRIENIHLIFTKKFSQTVDFTYFFCLKVSKDYLGNILIINSQISINSTEKNNFWDSNYSLFEVNGSNFIVRMENITMLTLGYEIFKNLMLTLPLEKDSIGERGFIIKNARFMGGNSLQKIRGYFLDILVEMTSVTIENIRSWELVGIRSLFKLENSTFYLNYPYELVGRQANFFYLEKSELIVKQLLLMGKTEKNFEENNNDVFIFGIIECRITIFQLLMQKIFVENVISKK
jgi:hypothetical protein